MAWMLAFLVHVISGMFLKQMECMRFLGTTIDFVIRNACH